MKKDIFIFFILDVTMEKDILSFFILDITMADLEDSYISMAELFCI